jgi:hypothetical protein
MSAVMGGGGGEKPHVLHLENNYGLLDFFNWPNPSSLTMALGSTQPITEMSIRKIPGGKLQSTRKADNLTAISEPIV